MCLRKNAQSSRRSDLSGRPLSSKTFNTPPGYVTMTGMDSATPPTPGYAASKDQLMRRLARVEGQVRGVAGMIDAERYCIDVLTQIRAVQAALDKVALGLLDDHTRECLMEADSGTREQLSDELMGAIGRLVRRG